MVTIVPNYLILLLPVFGLVVFWVLPLPIASGVYTVVLVITAFLYHAVMSAMRCPVHTGSQGMIGQIGKIIDVHRDNMRVLVHGEIWRVEDSGTLHMGESVRVTGIHGLSLNVQHLK